MSKLPRIARGFPVFTNTAKGGAMVVGRDFAWAHLPKTGGDATWALFRCVPDLVVRAHSPDDPAKHRTFVEEGVAELRLVLNLRRLPSLALSYVHHARNYGIPGAFPRGYRMTPAEAVAFDRPERALRRHLDRDRLDVHRWLRMEHLREDFLDFVGSLRPLHAREIERVRGVPTKPSMSYDHDPLRFFTSADIERLYANNPTWARHELAVYGTLTLARAGSGGVC
jgi:hypothetical protein